jgi:hypothetical protein
MVLVGFDIAICLIFLVGVMRVRGLEDFTSHDLKHGVYSIDDFTILIENIPIPASAYNNSPELLASMIVPHLEEVLRNEV